MAPTVIGFIGLGVMGMPMCRHLAVKSGARVLGFDRDPVAVEHLTDVGVIQASGIPEVSARCDVIFLALPSGEHVRDVACAAHGLLTETRAGQIIVDLGTSPVNLARKLAADFAARGATFCDAPVARTRAAAENAALSVMVGADPAAFQTIKPLLACFATDITHCGPAGAGQTVKILNNMVLIETVVALSEALALAKAAGLDGRVLFETLAKGSADSFALRNHGIKAMLPGVFPERAFSTAYALKDVTYALALAAEHGVVVDGAQLAADSLKSAIDAGHGDQYWPVISTTLAQKKT
jgi:3-hydroxyisobutyrate dehydrogenase-like beta-hydroxyacid dehydrogenase